MNLTTALQSLLDSAPTERPVLAWLKKNPIVLTRAIQFGRYVAAEFPFGSDFRADFVVLGPYSGGFDVHFVELEPPKERLFTKAGNPARRLAGAVAQIDSWRSFIEHDRSAVIRDLAKFFRLRELVYKRRTLPRDHCGWPLYHPQLELHWTFKIIIGRRADLVDEHIQKKASYRLHHHIEIMTYDRLLEASGTIDNDRAHAQQSRSSEPGDDAPVRATEGQRRRVADLGR
ncbi:MAG: Shedu anti-phage system protein SduA domain-containing protein [Limisphaerales bacterium]